jgi:hypothetical protein
MSRLAEALTAYLAQRAPGAVASGVPGPLEQPALSQEAKLTIAGVHSRWPALLVALSALALGGVYQAERHGWLRVRELGSGWLTPARLGADAAPNLAPHDYEQSLPLFRSIYAAEPAVDGLGALTLRAVPERELAPSDPSAAPVAEAPISSNERIRRIAAYREYLKSQSLTPLREVLPTLRDDTAHAPTDDPAP